MSEEEVRALLTRLSSADRGSIGALGSETLQLLATHPGLVGGDELTFTLAITRDELGDPAGALVALDRVDPKGPLALDADLVRAQVLEGLGRGDEAAAVARRLEQGERLPGREAWERGFALVATLEPGSPREAANVRRVLGLPDGHEVLALNRARLRDGQAVTAALGAISLVEEGASTPPSVALGVVVLVRQAGQEALADRRATAPTFSWALDLARASGGRDDDAFVENAFLLATRSARTCEGERRCCGRLLAEQFATASPRARGGARRGGAIRRRGSPHDRRRDAFTGS